MTYTGWPIADAPPGPSTSQPAPTPPHHPPTPPPLPSARPTAGPPQMPAGAHPHVERLPPPDDRADKNRRRRKKRLHLPVTGARAIQRIRRRTGRRTLV